MLGLWGATALVVSGMVGAGILKLPKAMAAYGSWSIAGWVLSALMAYSIALIFNRLAEHFSDNDEISSPVDFIQFYFKDQVAYIIAFGYFFATTAACAYVAEVFADYVFEFLPYNKFLLSASVMFLLFALNVISFGASGSSLIVLTILKIVFFLLISLFGLKYFNTYEFAFGNVENLFASASTAMFAFIGVEYAVLARDSIEDPEKNVILSTKIGLFFALLVFLGVHCATIFVLKSPANALMPVYEAGLIMFGDSFKYAICLIGSISCLTTLNGILIVQGSNSPTCLMRA